MIKKQAVHSPHGWENQDLKKLNDQIKAKVKRFEADEKLIQICKTSAHSFNCKPILAVSTAKSNHEATQMQIKLKLKIYNPLKRDPLLSARTVLRSQP